ncbi:hypothetical protein D3C71_1719790 [compost metagenome]
MGLGALGELGKCPALPHGVRCGGVSPGGRVILHPALAGGELSHKPVRHLALYRDPAPFGIGDIYPGQLGRDRRAELRIADAGVLPGSRRLNAVQANPRHNHVDHAAAFLVDRNDVDRLQHWVQVRGLAVGQDDYDRVVCGARVQAATQNLDKG